MSLRLNLPLNWPLNGNASRKPARPDERALVGPAREIAEPPPTPSPIAFAGGQFADSTGPLHTLTTGTPGAGKSVTNRLAMQSVLPDIPRIPGRRAVVADQKQEMIPLLYGMGIPPEYIVITNPADARAREWALCEDCRDPDVAYQIATIFVPEESGPNRFFSDAARDLIFAVM